MPAGCGFMSGTRATNSPLPPLTSLTIRVWLRGIPGRGETLWPTASHSSGALCSGTGGTSRSPRRWMWRRFSLEGTPGWAAGGGRQWESPEPSAARGARTQRRWPGRSRECSAVRKGPVREETPSRCSSGSCIQTDARATKF